MSCNNNTRPLLENENITGCAVGCMPIDINVVCKKMIIPIGQERISIQGENNSNSRTFIIPKVTENGDDLTEMGFIIITKDSSDNTHTIPVQSENIEHLENYIKIKWTLDENETINSGDFYVEIEAGNEDFRWKTLPGKFFISESIKPSEYEEEIEPSIVETLMLDIAANSDKIKINEESIVSINERIDKNVEDIEELKEIKQDNLISGDNIEIKEGNIISVVGVEKVKNAYLEIEKIEDYLYSTYYGNIDYEYAKEYFKNTNISITAGACSSFRKGNWYGRNLDWTYDNSAEFIVKIPSYNNRYASIGVCGNIPSLTKDLVESGEYNELYKLLPFCMLDGINEKGLFCNTNVVPLGNVPMDKTIPTISKEDEIPTTMLARYVVDRFSNAEEAINYLKEHVSIYANKNLQEMGYEAHYMIGDENKTYVLEFINNEMVYKELNIMTNFHLNNVTFNNDEKVYTPADVENGHLPSRDNGIEKFGSGLERYNLIVDNYNNITDKNSTRNILNELLYTRTYPSCTLPEGASEPFWFTEYVGNINNVDYTVDTLPETFNYLVSKEDEFYVNRTRDAQNKTWQTVHSSIYDIANRKLYVIVQENGIEKEFGFDYYYTAKEIDEKFLNENQEINNIEIDLNKAKEDIKTNTQNIFLLDSRVAANKTNLDNLAQSMSINIRSVSQDIQTMGQNIRNVSQDSQTNAQNINVNSQAISEHDRQITESANKIDAAEQKINSNENDIIDLQDELSGLIEKTNNIKDNHDTLVGRVTSLELTQTLNASKNPVDIDNSVFYYDNGVLKVLNSVDLCFQSVSYGGGESGYRKYRNGILEQWGVATTNAAETEFNLHQAYRDTKFSIFVEPREVGNFFHYAIPSANQKFKCRIQSRDSVSMAIKFQWRSWGYWK